MNKFKEFLNYSKEINEGIPIDVKSILFVLLIFSFMKFFGYPIPFPQRDVHLIK